MPTRSWYCGGAPIARSAILPQPDEIVGNSPQIEFIKQCIDRVAPSDAPVLITGETGTGKELFARRVHRMSNRRERPFVSINCAALPDNLLESELFGFEKGAFTGAVSRQEGMLVAANGGTVFLDEIGDLSPSAQAKLLRVLEQKEVRPLGSGKTQAIDFRLVAATNRDLEQLTSEGKFRQDLLFRINVIHVHIPPLRERQDDIPLIADYFLQGFITQYPRGIVSLTLGAQRCLKQLPWIGNVRELRNVIERAFLLSSSECITEQAIVETCDSAIYRHVRSTTETPIRFQAAPKFQSERRVAHTSYKYPTIHSSETSELEQIRKALEKTRWNKSEAAKILQCSRMTLYRKVVRYELRPPTNTPSAREPGA
ncbi:MAG TPA: sigma 54-interacting transcriptional regulator [Bryobacteraceae bacterium]